MMTSRPSDNKVCTQCARAVPLDGYYKWGGKRGNKPMAECKECFKARVAKRWPDYRERSVDLRHSLRLERKAAGDDRHYKELIAFGGGNSLNVPIASVTQEMVELKRLQVALARYAKDAK